MMAKIREEKGIEERRGGVFWEEEKKENITIALFNPDRGTNKLVLPSFKKVPVFFLSLRYVGKERERETPKRKERRTVLNIIIIMRFNQRKMHEQTAYSSSRSLSLSC